MNFFKFNKFFLKNKILLKDNKDKKLTTPFWTLKPNWYFVSGLFILTSTTGGVETIVNLTAVEIFEF